MGLAKRRVTVYERVKRKLTIVGIGFASCSTAGDVGNQTVTCHGANCGNGERLDPSCMVDTLKGPLEEKALVLE